MSKASKKLKTETSYCLFEVNSMSSSLAKPKPQRKTLKSRIIFKKEPERTTKRKAEEKLCKKKEPVKKKRKRSDCEKESIRKKVANQNHFAFNWTDEEYLARAENLSIVIARNIIDLFSKGNTIPFIARYRSDLTGDLKPDELRKVKATYEYIQLIHNKAEKLVQKATAKEPIPLDLLACIQCARTVEDLEFIGSNFKKSSKRSLAEAAKQLGLEVPAKSILEGEEIVILEALVDPTVPGLKDIKEVKLGIQHIIADIISKNSEVHAELEKVLYGDFTQAVNAIKPHQTLAINRGESENELLVKIVIPDNIWLPLKRFCSKKWLKLGRNDKLRTSLFSDSVDDSIKRLLKPLAVRRIRANLNAKAEDEALYVFGSNLRQLLMTRPYSGHVVMGIDPGFVNGCKVAVVTAMGDLIAHDKFFLNDTTKAKKTLKSLVLTHDCEIIALGNGTACRQTETLINDFIKRGVFKPLNVSYTIINEQGTSIYSCSPAATEEFPNLDPKIVSAVSLARRLQNPLSELVKVEPKHLGVGMYQHDMREKILVSTLDDIVSECVSFVGVDINSASFYLLKRIAGLNASKAREIIKYRMENCSFKCREDLKKVKGIKTKTFQQCAGFIRIIPSTARCRNHTSCQNDFNPLDETSIHPESYEAANKIIKRFGLNLNQLGSEEFVKAVTILKNSESLENLAKYCECSMLSVSFIIDTFIKPKNFDLRSLSAGPIFRKEVKKLEELIPGQILEGIVRNVVTFGAFVDIGVGPNGLIHTSQMGNNILQINNRVKVAVISIAVTTQRIELKLISVM